MACMDIGFAGEVATETTDAELGDDKRYGYVGRVSYGGGRGGYGGHGGYEAAEMNNEEVSFSLLLFISAVVLLIASEVAAQTTTEMDNGDVATETTDAELGDDKRYGYGGHGSYSGGRGSNGGGHGGYKGGHGGYKGGHGGYKGGHGGYKGGHGGYKGGHGGYKVGHGGYKGGEQNEAAVMNNED
ncbi:dormancy-associated protein 2-like [Hibiscus syriacus]|uniref:dormancy-associated protein 2-like n=1 Tax=Hibiscus syriacus TaxID=106335 RepID=UPI00192053A9|nr:dormancy-associated protein 2-like [Hibiscus syriacus]